jgi:hypothetical protein
MIMATIKKNESMKAFSSVVCKANRTEWEIAFNTNYNRGKVYDQHELLEMFDRNRGDGYGATKTVHVLEHIVVKRHQTKGYLPELRNRKATGNQLIDEINCFKEFVNAPEGDLLCPVFKYFTSKSDKVSATSETMQHNVLIIAQKAIKVGDADYMCRKAEELNRRHGYNGESAASRYRKLEKLSESQNWRDALYNGGNSGVIFDYAKQCYKAVFIDYAL